MLGWKDIYFSFWFLYALLFALLIERFFLFQDLLTEVLLVVSCRMLIYEWVILLLLFFCMDGWELICWECLRFNRILFYPKCDGKYMWMRECILRWDVLEWKWMGLVNWGFGNNFFWSDWTVFCLKRTLYVVQECCVLLVYFIKLQVFH